MQPLMSRRRRPACRKIVRHSRVARIRRIRAAIRAGDYENALKLDVALDRLLDRMLQDVPLGRPVTTK